MNDDTIIRQRIAGRDVRAIAKARAVAEADRSHRVRAHRADGADEGRADGSLDVQVMRLLA